MLSKRCYLSITLAFLLSLPAPLTGFFTLSLWPSGAIAHDTGLEMGRDPRDHVLGRGSIPTCDHPSVLRRITATFNRAERKTWSHIAHRAPVQLLQVTKIRQKYALEHTKSLIRHRHCNGHGHLSNGQHPRVHYVISERQGFASIGWRVEVCVQGRDRWRVYGAHCRSLR